MGDNDPTARLVELRELFRRQFQNGSDNRVCEEALHIAESLLSRLQAAEKVVEAAEKFVPLTHAVNHGEWHDARVDLREALAAWKEQG